MREILQGFIKAEGKKSRSAGGQENVPIKFFKTVVCNLGQEKLTKTFQGEKGSITTNHCFYCYMDIIYNI